jgi:hypothetical protein
LLLQAPAQFSRVFWFLSHTCPLVQTKEAYLHQVNKEPIFGCAAQPHNQKSFTASL